VALSMCAGSAKEKSVGTHTRDDQRFTLRSMPLSRRTGGHVLSHAVTRRLRCAAAFTPQIEAPSARTRARRVSRSTRQTRRRSCSMRGCVGASAVLTLRPARLSVASPSSGAAITFHQALIHRTSGFPTVHRRPSSTGTYWPYQGSAYPHLATAGVGVWRSSECVSRVS